MRRVRVARQKKAVRRQHDTTLATGSNASQIEFWNGVAGDLWAGDAFAACQDRAQGPFGEAAMDALGLQPGQHVLDVGCGCGSTTFELSRHVLGVDISTP
jgi:tRNA/tmRNA/rRNA uracil-C5-methylase (TrmA/RlmC/RlmD family)